MFYSILAVLFLIKLNNEIRPETLKALTGEGILWLTRVCQVAWKFGKIPRDWQTGVIIPIF